MISTHPIYNEHTLLEFRGNPLVEVLSPLPASPRDQARLLVRRPLFEQKERDLDTSVRRLLPLRLKDFMFPLNQHVKIFSHVYGNIVSGYRNRNPMTPDGQRTLYGTRTPSTVTFITGFSGMGKSALIRSVMRAIGPSVVQHNEYNGVPFPEKQILYIMQNVPDKCTPKNLCQKLGLQVDKLLGKDLCAPSFSKNRTQADYVASIERMLRHLHVGAIVIDEFQNVQLGRGSNKDELIAMISNFRDELGVPLFLVGTPDAERLLEGNASVARRLCEGGFFELRPPSSAGDEEWRTFCKTIWRLQWVKNPIELTDELIEILFEKSQGIIGILLTLFINAQLEAIGGREQVDATLLNYVYDEHMRPLHGALDALRSKNPRIICQFDDLYFSTANTVKNLADCRLTELQKIVDSQPMLPPPESVAPSRPRSRSLNKPDNTEQLLEQVMSTSPDEEGILKEVLGG